MGELPSQFRIIDAFGAAKYHCLMHQTEGVLRLTVNDVDYDACPQCFGLWLKAQFPVTPIA